MPTLSLERIAPHAGPIWIAGARRPLISTCHLARTRLARAVGLLGTSSLAEGAGLLIPRCSSVHSMAMRVEIACAWIGPDGRVLRVDDPLPPWRVTACRGALGVLEARPGLARRLRAGVRLTTDDEEIRRAVGLHPASNPANCEESRGERGEVARGSGLVLATGTTARSQSKGGRE